MIVDGGSLLFKNNNLPQGGKEQAELFAETLVEAYNHIGYEAVGVGGRDLAAGMDFLLKIRDKSRFAWLSANIIDEKSGAPIFKPYISKKLGDLNIAVIGLTDPTASLLEYIDATITPWQRALPPLIKDLAAKTDFIILLTDLPVKECGLLASNFPAINLIIQAQDLNNGRTPLPLSDTAVLVTSGKKGKYVGVMKVIWRPGSKWQDSDKILMNKIREGERLEKQLALLKNRPRLQSHYDSLQKRLDVLSGEIVELEKKAEAETVSSYENNYPEVIATLPEEPAVKAMVDRAKESVAKINSGKKGKDLAADTKKTPDKEGYSGWTTCGRCHPEQVTTWRTTPHYSSYLTLVEKAQQFNLDCLPCHITGIDPKDPAAALDISQELQAVSCESCHGPGKLHSNAPVAQRTRAVTAEICLSCHTPEQDDSFDFVSDVKKLKCNKKQRQ